ncbi:MAG TPA: TetR/AcrR family transcriptional regulator [Polyangiaceae bacterium]|nr:TetR/AcrR family transcriptional regulator [Polyangiaceae bacterium]
MTRQTQKEATRARILEVARLHFERAGFEAASIRAIAEEAEVASGTVLLHFTDKTSLLHAALHDDLEAAIERSLGAPSRGKLLARLSAVVRPFYAYYEARPRLSKVLLRESLLAKSPWRERFSAQALRVTAHVAELAEQAKASGELSSDTHAQLFATAFASFYYFALIGWVQEGVAAPLPLFEALMAQHLAAASPRPVPAAARRSRR